MEPTPEQTAFMAKNWRDLIRPRTLEIEERSRHLRQVLVRAARAWLRHHARRRAAPHPPVLAPGRGDHAHRDRRRAARVHRAPRRRRGRHRHHPQPQGDALQGRARQDVHGPHRQAGRGRRHRGRHRARRRRHLPQPEPPASARCRRTASSRWSSRSPPAAATRRPSATRAELPVGTIAIDALFSPIRKVNFIVTNARVGQQTDYDKLTLEVLDQRLGPPGRRRRVRREDPQGAAQPLHQLRRDGGAGRGPASTRPPRSSTRTSGARSTSSSSRSARRTASRTPTSSTSASWCRRPSPRCSRPRTSAASR